MAKSKAEQALERAAQQEQDPLAAVMAQPEVQSLTDRFHDTRRRGQVGSVDVSIDLGLILDEGRKRLGRTYGRWRSLLKVEATTARNYINLAHLSRTAPSVVEQWRDLGPAKLYRIARLTPAARHKVLRMAGLREMTDRDFAARTRPHMPAKRKATGNMRAHGLRMKLRGFSGRLKKVKVPRNVDAKMRTGLLDDLAELILEVRRIQSDLK